MTIPTKPDFAKAYQSANEILVTSSVITKFPFSTKELVTELFANQSPLVCRSYQKAKKYGLEITDFGSQSALLTQYGSRSLSFMTIQSQKRMPGFRSFTNSGTR